MLVFLKNRSIIPRYIHISKLVNFGRLYFLCKQNKRVGVFCTKGRICENISLWDDLPRFVKSVNKAVCNAGLRAFEIIGRLDSAGTIIVAADSLL